jgi:hypothetical protein
MDTRRKGLLGAGIGTGLAGTALLMVLVVAARPAEYRPGPHDDQPPADPHYHETLRIGLAGDRAAGRRQLLQLAREHPGMSEAAWCLYQAALGARADGDQRAADSLLAELRRDFAGHPLTLRLDAPAASAASLRGPSRTDCGPRALLVLCEEAHVPATLPELARLCGTTERGTTLEGLCQGARAKGLRALGARVDAPFLERHRPQGISWVDGDHFVAFGPAERGAFWALDPNEGFRRRTIADDLVKRCQGIVVLVAWGSQSLPPVQPANPEGRHSQ